MPREAPRETDSGPKTSPLARSAAKSVALGPFRGTWQVRLPRGAPREKDSGGAPSPLGCSAPRVSQNGPRAKASPFGEFSLGMFCAARVTGRPEGESPVIRRFSLGLFRGVGRLPWQASRHLRAAAAAGGPEGDGIEAENVSLGPFRGEKRRPWPVLRHLTRGTWHAAPHHWMPAAFLNSLGSIPTSRLNSAEKWLGHE